MNIAGMGTERVPERGRSPHQKGALLEISQKDHTKMEGRPKTAEFSSFGATGSQ